MTIYYILLFSSALLFAFVFLFTKQYEKYKGGGIIGALKLSIIANALIALMFFTKNAVTQGAINFYFSLRLLIRDGAAGYSLAHGRERIR